MKLRSVVFCLLACLLAFFSLYLFSFGSVWFSLFINKKKASKQVYCIVFVFIFIFNVFSSVLIHTLVAVVSSQLCPSSSFWYMFLALLKEMIVTTMARIATMNIKGMNTSTSTAVMSVGQSSALKQDTAKSAKSATSPTKATALITID